MASFEQTVDAIRADDSRIPLLAAALAVLVLAGWAAWFFGCPLRVLEVSERACIETSGAPFTIQAPVDGRVLEAHLELGREVAAGELLVQLDATTQELELGEARAQLAALPGQIQSSGEQVAAEERALGQLRRAGDAARGEAREKLKEGRARARVAEEEAIRSAKLQEQGYLAELELLRRNSEANALRAELHSLEKGELRVAAEGHGRENEGRAALEQARTERGRLAGERSLLEATIRRLSAEIEKRQLRSPSAGSIAESSAIRSGGYLKEGDRLGSIVARGQPRVVAELAAATAIGRVRPGQAARLRLTSFAWEEYGSLQASVTSIGQEARDGRVRAELALEQNPRIPTAHGLCGVLEIETERATPFALVLRSAGQRLAAGERPDS